MRFTGSLIRMINGAMGYLVHVRDQEGVRVQVSVDRNVGCTVGQYPKIAKPGTSGPDNTESERELLVKLLAIGNSW